MHGVDNIKCSTNVHYSKMFAMKSVGEDSGPGLKS